MNTTDWKSRLSSLICNTVKGDGELCEFAEANVAAIEGVVMGEGPDGKASDPNVGAHVVFNISSVHVPAFCKLSSDGDAKPYKNAYDIHDENRIGQKPQTISSSRETVDSALPLKEGEEPSDVYFGAVELTGAGIRFYGDICLVLKRETINDDTIVLDRNSYDLIRAPIRNRIESKHDQATARKDEAFKLMGEWKADIGTMSAIKVIQNLGVRARRYTTGQIAVAIRDDEDYMEVLKIDSFGVEDLQEARLSASDAAHDALTGHRLLSRPPPRMESLIWLQRRRQAEEALRSICVRVRVVTTPGRTKD